AFAPAPTVASASPAAGARQVGGSAPVAVAFSEAVNPATVNASTFYLTDAAGNVVAAAVSYNAATFTATLTPNAPLTAFASYTATVVGGAPGVRDLAGFAVPSAVTWSFTVDGP